MLPQTKPTKTKDVRELWETCRQLLNQTCENKFQPRTPNLYLTNIDHVPSNGTHSGSSAMLYVIEDVIDEARNKCRKVHFASLVDLCHLKNLELECHDPEPILTDLLSHE